MSEEIVTIKSREELIWRSLHTERVWMAPEAFGLAWEYNPTRRVEIGPWVCDCGFQCRDAGRMWDHTQTCQGAAPTQQALPFDEVA